VGRQGGMTARRVFVALTLCAGFSLACALTFDLGA
jgi:hypothetical protein